MHVIPQGQHDVCRFENFSCIVYETCFHDRPTFQKCPIRFLDFLKKNGKVFEDFFKEILTGSRIKCNQQYFFTQAIIHLF